MWQVRRRRRRPGGGGIEIVRRRRRRPYGENGEFAAPQAPPLGETATPTSCLRPNRVCFCLSFVVQTASDSHQVRVRCHFSRGAALARRAKVAQNNIWRREPGKGQRFGGSILWRTKNSHHIIHPGSE
eukprot:gene8225-biopygen15146